MTIYFIQNEKGRIKIGAAVNPETRLKELLTSSDEKLTLIGTKPGGSSEERKIHQKFSHAHVVREWFEPVPELLEYIRDENRKKKQEIIVFSTDEKNFPFEIIDHKGERWVTRKQLEAALDVSDLRHLHIRLVDRGELKENIHFIRFRDDMTRNPQGGNPNTIVYSYRGIIRVSMASEGKNAIIFRDWAEDVLYSVMTTGWGYRKPLSKLDSRMKAGQFFQKAISEGKRAGLSEKDSVLRAYTVTLKETGYDFSDAIPDRFRLSPINSKTLIAEEALGQFISECCETGKDFKIKAGELYKAYLAWAMEKNHKPMTQTRFGTEIKKRFDSHRSKKGLFYIGIRLKKA